MSASSKKKQRSQADASKMTERQLAEQKEARQIRLYTILFVIALAVMVVTAVSVGVTKTISASGVREKNTVAMSIGGNNLSNAELNYYYMDTVNNFYSQSGAYASIFGLDVSKPLDQQIADQATGDTWADYFLNSAKDAAVSTYALCDAAAQEGYTLSEADQVTVENTVQQQTLYAKISGYPSTEKYLKAIYGNGATEEGYRSYVEKSVLADSFYNAHSESLTYTDADLRAAEKGNYNAYSSFTFHSYYLPVNSFLTGGTTDADGKTTYSDEEQMSAEKAALAAAKSLTDSSITSPEALDAAIAALEINKDTTAASTLNTDLRYSSVNVNYQEWVSDASRKTGDKAYFASTGTADDGSEEIYGYYVVYYLGTNDNTFALRNVRHILAKFEGGTANETGATVYSDEEKAAAKAEAEELLNQWKSGEATEDSFAQLAAEKTDDTASAENGGLYEDVYPGQMVSAFESWCYDSARKSGDTGIVETEYGYHVMYFVGDSDLTYRDYQITTQLRQEDMTSWYSDLLASNTATDGDTSYIRKDIILSAN